MKAYFEAYDDRYRQVHGQKLQWFSDAPTPIVGQILQRYQISETVRILELGCGEGRDAADVLERGYDLLATDISPEAIAYCRRKYPRHADRFAVLDCVREIPRQRYGFIYAVAVIHMLVRDKDREAFYRFIRDSLEHQGIALICTMGDGTEEFQSDIRRAFDLQKRRHQSTGTELLLSGTSCRVVGFDTFREEMTRVGLRILEMGLTAAEPDFSVMMYGLVCANDG